MTTATVVARPRIWLVIARRGHTVLEVDHHSTRTAALRRADEMTRRYARVQGVTVQVRPMPEPAR